MAMKKTDLEKNKALKLTQAMKQSGSARFGKGVAKRARLLDQGRTRGANIRRQIGFRHAETHDLIVRRRLCRARLACGAFARAINLCACLDAHGSVHLHCCGDKVACAIISTPSGASRTDKLDAQDLTIVLAEIRANCAPSQFGAEPARFAACIL